jgi:hypothetical protein
VSRTTMRRQWTEAERELAGRIAFAVHAAGGELVGALTIARALGMPYGPRSRRRSLRRIHDVMPLAVLLSREMFPGKVLLQISGERLYRITDEPMLAKHAAIRRIKKVRTIADRVRAEITPLRGRTDLGSLVVCSHVDQLDVSLRPEVWDAIVAEAENSR